MYHTNRLSKKPILVVDLVGDQSGGREVAQLSESALSPSVMDTSKVNSPKGDHSARENGDN